MCSDNPNLPKEANKAKCFVIACFVLCASPGACGEDRQNGHIVGGHRQFSGMRCLPAMMRRLDLSRARHMHGACTRQLRLLMC